MDGRRGRRWAIGAAALSVLLLAAAGAALYRPALEGWWIGKLRAGTEEEKQVAVRRLGELRSARAVPELAKRIVKRRLTPEPRREATSASPVAAGTTTFIWRCSQGGILEISEDAGFLPIDPAAAALQEIGEPAVPALAGLLGGGDSYAAAQAMYVLGELGPRAQEALPALRGYRARENESLVPVAAGAIRKIEGSAASRVPP